MCKISYGCVRMLCLILRPSPAFGHPCTALCFSRARRIVSVNCARMRDSPQKRVSRRVSYSPSSSSSHECAIILINIPSVSAHYLNGARISDFFVTQSLQHCFGFVGGGGEGEQLKTKIHSELESEREVSSL